MNDDDELHRKAREAIQAGRIPTYRPENSWGGRGDGSGCVICHAMISREEFELELEFAGADTHPGSRTCHVHIRCFAAWEAVRHEMTAPRVVPATGSPAQLAAASVANGAPETGYGAARSTSLSMTGDGAKIQLRELDERPRREREQ